MLRKKIIHFTGTDQRKQANAAFLIGCYMVSASQSAWYFETYSFLRYCLGLFPEGMCLFAF